MTGDVQVSLLYFDGCPNWDVADGRLREALARVGHGHAAVEYRQVTTVEEAEEAQFRGYPTVLVNGRDPFLDHESPVGLSCRVQTLRLVDGVTDRPSRVVRLVVGPGYGPDRTEPDDRRLRPDPRVDGRALGSRGRASTTS